MRKLAPLFMALVLAVSTATAVFAEGNSALQYTFTFTDLGQPGAHGGGRLYAGGSADGGLTLSALDGQVIEQLEATSWSEVVPGLLIDICFDVQSLKGPSLLPPTFCFSRVGLALAVSGTPVIISNPFGGVALVRVTPVN